MWGRKHGQGCRLSRTGLIASAVAASVVIAALLSARGPAGRHSGPSPRSASSTAAPSAERARAVSTAEEDVLYLAEETLTRDCMAELGFRFWVLPRSPFPDYRQFPYVLTDVAWARVHGYGRDIEQRVERDSVQSAPARYLRSLPSQRQQAMGVALSGPEPIGLSVANPLGGTLTHSDKGCTAAAWRQLYGDPQGWFSASEITMNVGAFRADMVTNSTRFTAGVSRWRRCMRSLGYAVSDPPTLRRQELSRPGPDRTQELRAATAEASCATSSGLASTAEQLDERYERVVEQRYRAAFEALWTMQRRALPIARRVLAHPEPDIR